MGRRDGDERPPIEVLGSDPGIGSTQQVHVGPRRPRRARVRSLAIVALVVAALVGGLALGGHDDELEGAADEEPRDNHDHIELGQRTTTTTRPTTTTTARAPVGPVFGEPIEGVLLMNPVGSTWSRLDLATGVLDEITLPATDMYNTVAIRGGLAIPTGGGEVRFYPVLGSGAEPEGVVLGPGDQVGRAGPERVWLFDQPQTSNDGPVTHIRLVDLQGRVHQELEVSGWQSTATTEEVLVGRGGRVYVVEDHGFRAIATGWVTGVVGDDALITACDDDGDCALRLQPTDGGRSRVLANIEDPDAVYYDPPAVAADGRVALVSRSQVAFDQRLLLFGSRGEPLGDVQVSLAMEGGAPQWLPGDLGLLLSTSTGVQWVRPKGAGWVVEDFPIEELSSPRTFFVITP